MIFKDPDPPLKSEKIIMDEAPPPGVVEHPATPEKLQEEPEEAAENDENEAEPQNETAG